MATFNVDDLDIDPQEYVYACRDSEIRELIDEIRDHHNDIFEEEIADDVVNSSMIGKYDNHIDIDGSFQNNLRILSRSFSKLSHSDEEIISIIAKKYGAV
jgi:hypothetical protein